MEKAVEMDRLREIVQEDSQQLEDVLSELESRVDFLLSHPDEKPNDRTWSHNR